MGKTIIVQPNGGLANRFMVLLSAMRLADLYKAKLFVHWLKSSDCVAELDDLFIHSLQKNPYDLVDAEYKHVGIRKDGGGWTSPPIVELIPEDKPLWVSGCVVLSHPDDNRDLKEVLPLQCSIQDLRCYFDCLQSSSSVSAKLRIYDSINFTRVFGLHVRRPYPASSIHHEVEKKRFGLPSDDAYLNMVETVLRTGKFDRVFLATNDFDTQKVLMDRFGDRIFVHPKKSVDNHQDLEAVQDGLVDMLLLSRCACIGRSQRSSYSYMAAVLGLPPMLMIDQANIDSLPVFSGVRFESDNHVEIEYADNDIMVALDFLFKDQS